MDKKEERTEGGRCARVGIGREREREREGELELTERRVGRGRRKGGFIAFDYIA